MQFSNGNFVHGWKTTQCFNELIPGSNHIPELDERTLEQITLLDDLARIRHPEGHRDTSGVGILGSMNHIAPYHEEIAGAKSRRNCDLVHRAIHKPAITARVIQNLGPPRFQRSQPGGSSPH
jgi:hypothetical protein